MVRQEKAPQYLLFANVQIKSSTFSKCMSINFAVPSKFWVHQIIKFGRNYSNQSPLPSCSILTTQENASAKATKFYTQMPQSPYSSDICTSTCDGSTWNLNLGSVFDLDKCCFRHCAEKGQKLKRKEWKETYKNIYPSPKLSVPEPVRYIKAALTNFTTCRQPDPELIGGL